VFQQTRLGEGSDAQFRFLLSLLRPPGGTHFQHMPLDKSHHWKLQFGEGIVLVVLGVAAVFVPFRMGIALLVWLLLIGGIAGLITTAVMRQAAGFLWSLLSAVLAIGLAAFVIAMPDLAFVGFPLLLMGFLAFEGILTIMLALEHWRERAARWHWLFASGIVDLCLAVLIVVGLPATATWALGLILAVNLIFGGGAMIGMGLAARGEAGNARA
jgi:uncharacterized membrane protein HdeD (DUF308 family)